MSMLGSPVGGVPYRFVDPSSVWKARASPPPTHGVDPEQEREEEGDGVVRVLLPAEDTSRGKPSDRRTVSSLHGTPYGISAQMASLPAPTKPRQDTGVLPGFRLHRTTRLMGPWEVYASDGWVLDRSRGRKCIVTSGERPAERERDSRDGILVDVYVPIIRQRGGTETDDEDPEGMTWGDHLRALREEVEADGGRLIEIDWTTGNANGHTSRTKTYLPVTQLPYLAHGLHPIHIPSGNYKQVKERLWMNLNLRRMGCSGRSSVGLAAPRSVLAPFSLVDHDLLTSSAKVRRRNINSSRNTASPRRRTDQRSNRSSSNSADSSKRHSIFTACTAILLPRTRPRTGSRRMG